MYNIVIQPISVYIMLCSPQVCYHQCYYNFIDYITYAVPCILMTYLLHNWKPISLNPVHIFFPHPIPLPSGNYQFILCNYRSDSAFVCLFICFVRCGVYLHNRISCSHKTIRSFYLQQHEWIWRVLC